jgi:hypothetical protein
MPMLFSVLILFIFIVELVLGIGLLATVFYPLKKSAWSNYQKRAIFVAVGALLVSPAVAPAGTLAIIPIPLGVLLACIRSSMDAMFLLKTWWLIAPSMLITAFVCRYVSHRLFSTQVAPASVPSGEFIDSPKSVPS